MTQEEKELLLRDLCARLPYGVMYETPYGPRVLNDIFIYSNGPVYTDHGVGNYNEVFGIELENIKPYLRPMSSMTEEEKEELKEEHKKDERIYAEVIERIANGDEDARGTAVPHFAADWCNKNHFDYRDLIPMGLALEAPEDMYKV